MDKKKIVKECAAKKDIIAYRKKCRTSGTGLSHYILLNKKKDR